MIKKIIFLCFIFISFKTMSQHKIYIGFKGGGHLNNAYLEHSIFNFNAITKNVYGYNAGMALKYFPQRNTTSFVKSGIQIGTNYFQKGWKQVFRNNQPDYTIFMNYLEIPLEGFGYFNIGKKEYVFISAGFYTEFLISYENSLIPEDNEIDDFVTYESQRDRKFGYGSKIGAGIFKDFSFGIIHLDFFFSYSFSNFIVSKQLSSMLPNISNLIVGGFSIGYFFPIIKKKENNYY